MESMNKAKFKKKLAGEGGIYQKGVANLEMGGQSRSNYGTTNLQSKQKLMFFWHLHCAADRNFKVPSSFSANYYFSSFGMQILP